MFKNVFLTGFILKIKRIQKMTKMREETYFDVPHWKVGALARQPAMSTRQGMSFGNGQSVKEKTELQTTGQSITRGHF